MDVPLCVFWAECNSQDVAADSAAVLKPVHRGRLRLLTHTLAVDRG